MAALTVKPLRPVGTISGNQWQVKVYPLAASATLRYGDVIVTASGLAARSASPVPATHTVLGVALHAAKQGQPWYLDQEAGDEQVPGGGTYGGTFMGAGNLLDSVEGTGVHVAIANPDTIFEGNLEEALAASLVGAAVYLKLDASGKMWIATTTGTGAQPARIVAIPNIPGQALGDTFARVWLQFTEDAAALF